MDADGWNAWFFIEELKNLTEYFMLKYKKWNKNIG